MSSVAGWDQRLIAQLFIFISTHIYYNMYLKQKGKPDWHFQNVPKTKVIFLKRENSRREHLIVAGLKYMFKTEGIQGVIRFLLGKTLYTNFSFLTKWGHICGWTNLNKFYSYIHRWMKLKIWNNSFLHRTILRQGAVYFMKWIKENCAFIWF